MDDIYKGCEERRGCALRNPFGMDEFSSRMDETLTGWMNAQKHGGRDESLAGRMNSCVIRADSLCEWDGFLRNQG